MRTTLVIVIAESASISPDLARQFRKVVYSVGREGLVKLRFTAVLGAFLAGLIGMAGGIPAVDAAGQKKPAATPQKPAISEEASAALLRMGQTLRAEQFSFQARTIRVYSDANGQPLHIF